MSGAMPARVVGAASGVRWLVEGWSIFRAAPLRWLALVFVYLFFMVLAGSIPYLGALVIGVVTPALSVSFMAVARAAHQREAIGLELLREGFRLETRSQLLLGVVYGICMGCILIIASLALNLFPDADAAQEAEAGGGDLIVLLLMYLPVAMLFWFSPVLVAWHGAPPGKALFFSCAAVVMNWRAFFTYGGATIALVLGLAMLAVFGARLLSPELAAQKLALPMLVAVYPVLLGSYYASYRDIFGYIAPSHEEAA